MFTTFFKYRDTLCNRQLALKLRFKLFESVMTPCILYACGTWTMTVDSHNLLRTARRKMPRWIVQVRRQSDEEWVEYIRRATHRSEELATVNGAIDWIELQRIRKWKLAGQTARRTDGRWSKRLLEWRPWCRISPRRDVGRPKKRWDDDLVKLAGEAWAEEATDKNFWNALETG